MAASAARMVDPGIAALGVRETAELVAGGTAKAEEVTRALLDRIAAVEDDVGAWAHVDSDHALDQARRLDRRRAAGLPLGPLHGVPVGIKDIIDVAGLPCERGTAIDAGRRPGEDATVAARLREAGAVILGKTVTTELAVYTPGKTRNPRDLGRTPGGSSSGSAAAVAACMVPGALGTQTNGSVIRPSSFCGIVGYKPSRGLVSRRGVLTQSPLFDTVGAMARSVEDAAMIGDAIAGFDPADRAMRPGGAQRLAELARSPAPVTPRFAFVRTPVWDSAEQDLKGAFAELADILADVADPFDLPEPFDRAHELHRTVMHADIARNFGSYWERGRDRLSERLRAIIEDGRRILAMDYILATDWVTILNAGVDPVFDRYDAILTPATAGQAPRGLDSTGDPAFCTIWTYCGLPAVTVPLLAGADGMPIGVQLVGRHGQDGRLLRTARWLTERLAREA